VVGRVGPYGKFDLCLTVSGSGRWHFQRGVLDTSQFKFPIHHELKTEKVYRCNRGIHGDNPPILSIRVYLYAFHMVHTCLAIH
jgi:hypothetical protein